MRGSGDKFREAVTQGAGYDELRGAVRRTHGAQPRAEVAPDQSRVEGGEASEQALGDEADLDVAVIGVAFSADGRAVGRGHVIVMDELAALKPAERRHRAHPEMIGPGADGVECLLETELYLEAQGIEPEERRLNLEVSRAG